LRRKTSNAAAILGRSQQGRIRCKGSRKNSVMVFL
jgi:hypothetical protein